MGDNQSPFAETTEAPTVDDVTVDDAVVKPEGGEPQAIDFEKPSEIAPPVTESVENADKPGENDTKPPDPVQASKPKPERRKIKFIKTGVSSHRMRDGTVIKGKDTVFAAYPDEIPEAFRDVIKPLEVEPDKDPPPKVEPLTYEVVSSGVAWFDVVDSNGKIVNEKKLRKKDADALVAKLTG